MQEHVNANSLTFEQSVTPVYTELRNVHHMPFQTTSGVDRHVHKYLTTYDSFLGKNDIYVGDMANYGNNQEQKPNVYNSRGRHIHYQSPEYTVNEDGVDNETCCTNTLPDIGSFFGSQKCHHTEMHTADNKAITTYASNIPLLPVRTTHVNVDEYLRKVQIPLLKQHFIDEPEAMLSDIHRKEDIVRNSITHTISLNDKHIDVFSKRYSQSPYPEFGDHAMMTCIRQTEPDNHRYNVPAFYKPVLEVCRSRSVNVKDFHCPYCPKTFSQTANLTAHKRIHSGEKPFQCTICNKKFTQSSSVKTHMRVHTGERPYACNECGKTFADSSTLTKHKRIHSGVKPYQCRICSQQFSQSGNLNRHTKVHILKDKIVSCA